MPIGVDQVWLDKTIADLEKSSLKEYFYIARADYEGMCVTYVNNCCPTCNTAIIVYHCDGTRFENAEVTKLKNESIVWKPDNFACHF